MPLDKIPPAMLEWSSSGDMNKTEARYAANVLEPALQAGEILWYAFEPFKLRLGQRNFYTPDFGVLTSLHTMQVHEVKAIWSNGKPGFKDDARQKLRDASQTYPFFQFIVAAMRSPKQMRTIGTSDQWVYEYLTPFETKPAPE